MRKDFIAQTLKWLSGKKGVIATLLTHILGYCFAKGYLDEATFNLLGGMLVIVFGGASIATKNIYSVNK